MELEEGGWNSKQCLCNKKGHPFDQQQRDVQSKQLYHQSTTE